MLHPYKSQINGEAVAGAPNTGDHACSALARLVGNGLSRQAGLDETQ